MKVIVNRYSNKEWRHSLQEIVDEVQISAILFWKIYCSNLQRHRQILFTISWRCVNGFRPSHFLRNYIAETVSVGNRGRCYRHSCLDAITHIYYFMFDKGPIASVYFKKLPRGLYRRSPLWISFDVLFRYSRLNANERRWNVFFYYVNVLNACMSVGI